MLSTRSLSLAAAWIAVSLGRLGAAGPEPIEQYAIELINRARSNPGAEAARIGIDLNEGPPSATLLDEPRPPMAIDLRLQEAAKLHFCWMLSPDGAFTHTASGTIGENCFTGINPWDRMVAAGYMWSEFAENLSISPVESEIPSADDLHRNLFHDALLPGRPHRLNLLNPRLKHIGIAWGNTSSLILKRGEVQVMGKPLTDGMAYLTGVVYDDVDESNFYTPGEGLGGVQLQVVGSDLVGETFDAGGYTIDMTGLADGGHTLRFTHDGKTTDIPFTKNGSANVKVDALAATFTDAPAPAGWAATGLDPLSDGDLDGLPALVEYAIGSDPGASTEGLWWDADSGALVLPGTRNDDWPDDVEIVVESSLTLTPDSWETLAKRDPNQAWDPAIVTSANGATRVTPPVAADPARYYRLRVSLP